MAIRVAGVLAVLLGLGSFAHADRLAVVANPVAMPLGLSLDLSYRLTDRFSVRAGGGLPVSGEAEGVRFSDVEYDMDVELGGLNAFAEWYPFAGNFRLSGGVTTVRSPWKLEAARVSTYNINGTSYPAVEVGSLRGRMEMGMAAAPALLVGWGNPVRRGKHWGLALDLGVAYVGREDFVLEADGPLASDPAFQRDLEAERERHSARHSFWPVLRLGVSYQF